MAHFISDRTPMDDYQELLNQADYYIENTDYQNRLPDNNRSSLDKTPAYIGVLRAMKILLIISGASLPVAIITYWAYDNVSSSHTVKLISMCSIIIVVTAFVLALLIGCAGAYMESRSEKKDKKTQSIQKSKTWVLSDGRVVVAYVQPGRGGQMVKPFVMDKNNIVDVPFSQMDVIDKVHRIHNRNGKVTVVADVTEYYITHPYVNEIPSDNISHYFHYYKRRKRRIFRWYSNIPGIDKLIQTLKGAT